MSAIKTALFIGVLLGLQSAQAEIIYSGANQNIFVNQFNPAASISLTGSDLKWDNLEIRYSASGCTVAQATTHPGDGSHVRTAGSDGNVSKLESGTVVNATINYTIRPQTFFKQSYSYEITEGNFQNQTGYIGLQLSKGASTYFGWAQISTANCDSREACLTVHDWACNTVAGQAILAGQVSIPEPNSMSLVAACAGGLLFIRRIFLI